MPGSRQAAGHGGARTLSPAPGPAPPRPPPTPRLTPPVPAPAPMPRRLLIQELAFKYACRSLAAGEECASNPLCTTMVDTCDYVITTTSPTSRCGAAALPAAWP